MKEVVINKRFGGYNVSHEASIDIFKYDNNVDKVYIYSAENYESDKCKLIKDIKFNNGEFDNDIDDYVTYISSKYLGDNINRNEIKLDCVKFMLSLTQNIKREDKRLIELIKEWGSERCSGNYSELKIVEIPDDVEYEIDDYDGCESIHEKHRIWE